MVIRSGGGVCKKTSPDSSTAVFWVQDVAKRLLVTVINCRRNGALPKRPNRWMVLRGRNGRVLDTDTDSPTSPSVARRDSEAVLRRKLDSSRKETAWPGIHQMSDGNQSQVIRFPRVPPNFLDLTLDVEQALTNLDYLKCDQANAQVIEFQSCPNANRVPFLDHAMRIGREAISTGRTRTGGSK